MAIKQEGNKFVIRSRKGRNLGEAASKAKAKKRLRQVEFFKRQKKGQRHG